MPDSLKDIATRFSDGTNPATKLSAGALYDLYDFYFRDLADRRVTLLELGVYSGESLKTFSTYFPRGKIIGIDLDDRGTDFSGHPNVHFEVCDQRDRQRLAAICLERAPEGVDIIIDDASHFGAFSIASYDTLFPFLKPSGLYIVEDWATGYWGDWPDGGIYEEPNISDKRIKTHDYGMVGFVKHLVDEVMSSGIRPSMSAPLTRPNRLDLMHVHKGMVVLKKAPDPSN